MEPPAFTSLHGRCVPWHIGTGNRRQICDFEVQPPPHDQPPRWVQEKPPIFQPSCSEQPLHFRGQQPLQIRPCLHEPTVDPRQPCDAGLQQELRRQRFFRDEMLMTDFRDMDEMEKRFYVPPEFRGQQRQQLHQPRRGNQVKDVDRGAFSRPTQNVVRRECRSMCMPEGMGAIDPNCQGEDDRVKSGYQPSRPGDAVDRRFDPCCKWKPFRDGTSAGHKAAHWQFGRDREGKPMESEDKNRDCEPDKCPENKTTIGNRSVYPKLGGMVPGYGGHVPGFERCKFGKTYGRETAEVLKKVISNDKFPRSYSMAEWSTKCYNKDINC